MELEIFCFKNILLKPYLKNLNIYELSRQVFCDTKQDWQNQQGKIILKRSIEQQYSSLNPELLLGKVWKSNGEKLKVPLLFKANQSSITI